ncbi:MAG: hypothetical protein Q8P57_02455 [Candidatus Pacearchaeota archaeon]|nr:hypothetical protein [Candidatus Pacearchaeota archaeon]
MNFCLLIILYFVFWSEPLTCWSKTVFPNYRKEMKGVDFGILYNEFGDKEFDQKK